MDISLHIWGFLVGFVGWGGFLRTAGPISAWLLENPENSDITVGITRIVIIAFLIFTILLVLCLLPLLLIVIQHGPTPIDANVWRNLYGVSFVSSLVGWVALGVIRRLSH